MRSKFLCALFFALFVPMMAAPATAQADYAGHQGQSRFAVGGGISGFNPGWGSRINYGPTVWVDYKPPFITKFVPGLGVEAEYRSTLNTTDHFYGEDSHFTSVGGGVTYHPRIAKFRRASPYVKYLGELGWNPVWKAYGPPFAVYDFGGGIDYNLSRSLVLRGDYEYSIWSGVRSFTHPGTISKDNPQGITLGVLYRFGGRSR